MYPVIVNTISRNVSVLSKFLVSNESFLSNLYVEIYVLYICFLNRRKSSFNFLCRIILVKMDFFVTYKNENIMLAYSVFQELYNVELKSLCLSCLC